MYCKTLARDRRLLWRCYVVTDAFAGITEAVRGIRRNEFPHIFSRPKRQLKDAETVRIACFAIRDWKAEGIVASSTRADDYFANAIFRIGIAIVILRGETLIRMLMAGQYKIRVGLVEVLPERTNLRVKRVVLENTAAEEGMMSEGDDAGVRVRGEVLPEPNLFS